MLERFTFEAACAEALADGRRRRRNSSPILSRACQARLAARATSARGLPLKGPGAKSE
jgi:hypothetical protein